MKIFIRNKEDAMSLQVKRVLRDTLLNRGHEIIMNEAKADIVFVEISRNSTMPQKHDVNQVFYKSINCRPVVLTTKAATNGERKFLKKSSTKNVALNYSKDDIGNLTKSIIDYLVGNIETVSVLDPFPFESLKDLIDIRLNIRRNSRDASIKLNTIKLKYSLSDIGMKVVAEEIMKASKLDSTSKIISMTSETEYIYTNSFGKGIMIPNVSFSLLSNLIKAYESFDISSIAKEELKKEFYFKRGVSEIDELKKTLKNSLFSKNSWKLYSKEENGGLYGLFIPDNSLEDCEIRIPKPTFSNLKTTIGGIEVAIIKKKKLIITTQITKEIKDFKRRMSFRVKEVDELDKALDKMKLYPSIGDVITVTRHPITTLMLEAKVVGYTSDGSIRINNKMIQSDEGDADGDSLTVSWNSGLKMADKAQLDEYIKIANIDLSVSKRDNLYTLDTSNKEVDKQKLVKSTIEQATAKLVTANLTGSFGVAERTIILSYIMAKKKVDLEVVYTRSRSSQLSVQAKNILAELQNGQLSNETLETFHMYYLAMEDKQEALNVLAAFLDTDVETVTEILFNKTSEIIEENSNNKLIELF